MTATDVSPGGETGARCGALIVEPRAEPRPQLLSIVCPAYNEAAGLASFHRAVRRALKLLGQSYEVVFVNDGSTDETLSVMRELRSRHRAITIVDLSRNYGKEIALTAGLDAARGDAVVVIDADLQDPPDLIGELIEGWREGYDVVYAQRRVREGDFRLMSRKAVDAVCAMRERHRFMKGVFAWVGFPSKVVHYDRAPREVGATKWNYWKLWNLSIEGVTSSTLAPLKISTYLGFFVALCAFLLGVFFVVKKLFFGESVQGFSTLIVVVSFLGGVQLAVLGVIGEYLGRVFNETKNRPLYFVNAVQQSDVETVAAERTTRQFA